MAKSEETAEMSGMKKAAVLMLALEPEIASRMLKVLEVDVVEDLTREIASMEMIEPSVRCGVVEEFYNLALANQYLKQGGLAYARALLGKAMSPEAANRILSQIEHQVHKQPFSFLGKTDGDSLLAFIQDEHPQTIALILSHVPAAKASEILTRLSQSKQLEVVTRVANMDQTNPEVVREVERSLERRLSGVMSQTFRKVGGVENVAEILNLVDRSTEKGILESLEAEDPDLVEQIRRLMFVFEDILLVNDKGIQAVLKEIDTDVLALALKTASDDLKDKIFSNMSERATQLIKEDMEYMGPVRVSDVEIAQQKIVDVVRRLEEAGEVIISGRGGESEVLV